MEAQKIKKKLNGSILRGQRIKIEDARPTKQRNQEEETTSPSMESMEVGKDKRETLSKKRKRGTETLPAIELEGRKVKRGWTNPVVAKKSDRRSKGSKDSIKSKYTSGPECLFRTTLPANASTSAKDEPVATNPRSEGRKKKKQAKDVVIHEFSRTMKHATFLRPSAVSSITKEVSEYVEDKGWVDADGNIVEALVARPKKATSNKVQRGSSARDSMMSIKAEENSNNENATEEAKKGPMRVVQEALVEDPSTSSSGTSSDNENEIDDGVSSESNFLRGDSSKLDKALGVPKPVPSVKTPIGLKIDTSKTEDTMEQGTTVHPLEALFKRRRPGLKAPKIPGAAQSFSFFDDDVEDASEDEAVGPMPMTPFTKQDFALRGLRSAAPTPDTAFPGKTYTIWPTNNVSEENGAEISNGTTPTQKQKAAQLNSQQDEAEVPVDDFQKWFYEHRGETNRAWKKRRKLAAKNKRQRENRKRNERAV